jgi:aminoglycoside phosphotransferase (APT) family kinase protein
MATNEMRFIKTHARPRMNYHRSSAELELLEEMLDLLDRYLQLALAMMPPLGTDDTHSPTLWHPDLHLDNVFVDPESKKITRIIDWRSAAVMPFFYQCGVSRMFQHPGTVADGWALSELPEDYDSLDQSEKAKIDSVLKSEACQKYYEAETKSKNPRHWAALQLQNADVRTEPSRLVMNVWEDRDVFFLRRALLSIVEQWRDFVQSLIYVL